MKWKKSKIVKLKCIKLLYYVSTELADYKNEVTGEGDEYDKSKQ